jgi:hypothetical protein
MLRAQRPPYATPSVCKCLQTNALGAALSCAAAQGCAGPEDGAWDVSRLRARRVASSNRRQGAEQMGTGAARELAIEAVAFVTPSR